MARQALDENNTPVHDFFQTVDVEMLAKGPELGRWISLTPEGMASSGRRTRASMTFVATVLRRRDEEGDRELLDDGGDVRYPAKAGL